jgi:hypothetical protein
MSCRYIFDDVAVGLGPGEDGSQPNNRCALFSGVSPAAAMREARLGQPMAELGDAFVEIARTGRPPPRASPSFAPLGARRPGRLEIAWSYFIDQAEQLHRRALVIKERRNGPEHPDITPRS